MILASASLICAQTEDIKPERKKTIALNEILVKFKFSSRINHPLEKINRELIAAIKERRVSFVLDDEISKGSKTPGAVKN